MKKLAVLLVAGMFLAAPFAIKNSYGKCDDQSDIHRNQVKPDPKKTPLPTTTAAPDAVDVKGGNKGN